MTNSCFVLLNSPVVMRPTIFLRNRGCQGLERGWALHERGLFVEQGLGVVVQLHIGPFTLTQDFNRLLLVVDLGVVSNVIAPPDEFVVAVGNGAVVVHVVFSPEIEIVVKAHHTGVEPFKDSNHELCQGREGRPSCEVYGLQMHSTQSRHGSFLLTSSHDLLGKGHILSSDIERCSLSNQRASDKVLNKGIGLDVFIKKHDSNIRIKSRFPCSMLAVEELVDSTLERVTHHEKTASSVCRVEQNRHGILK